MATHVVFGSGATGLTVARLLVERGENVNVVSRSGRTVEGADGLAGDVTDQAFANRATAGANVVYQVLNAPYSRWAEDFPPLQHAVVEAASLAGARLVTLENCYLYGDTHGEPMTEATPIRPTSRKGEVRAAMTEDLFTAYREGRVEATVGRASDYYGPGGGYQSMIGDRVVPQALAGKTASVIGDPDQPHSYTYLPDIARGLIELGDRPEAVGRAWHLPTAPALTMRDIVGLVFREAGTEPKLRSAPRTMLWLLGLFNADVRELREMLYEFEQPFVVDSSAFERTFGMAPTPMAQGIAETVDSYRKKE